jgi:uncharacterized protein (TIGR00255 family)
MVKSMTGYGKAETDANAGRIVAEIRSVNHRYGEISVKLPRVWLAFEHVVRKRVADRVKRGKVEVFIQKGADEVAGRPPTVNLSLARSYRDAFARLQEELGLDDRISLSLIAAQKDVLAAGEPESAGEAPPPELLAAVDRAVDSLEAMRCLEGKALLHDIRQRRTNLADLIARVGERAPSVALEYAERLRERVSQLMRDGVVDETRLAQEVSIMADRSDITEELVRFRSHLQQFDESLLLEEPMGRKLDFLLQELNREVNTIGSKANDAAITAAVVEMKSELEKIREQVQNIE